MNKNQVISAVIAAMMAAMPLAADAGLTATIDTVTHYLAGNEPLAELDSANVYLITRADIDYAQYEKIFSTYMIPFALQHRDAIPDADLAWLYRNLSVVYAKLGNHEREMAALDSAIILIDKVENDDPTKAAIYANAGDAQIRSGSIKVGHDMFFKAIRLYEQMGDNDANISNCLYQLAVGYLQIVDFAGLEYVTGKMQELCGKPDADPNCLYDLYSVLTALYSIKHDKAPDNKALSDSTLLYSRRAIDVIESNPGRLRQRIVPAWNYYNHARTLFHAPGTINYDSVEVYIDKSLAALKSDARINHEVQINVDLLQGEMAYKKQQYADAEKHATDAADLLKQYEGSNTLMVEREEMYKLLAKVQEATGRYRQATENRRLAEDMMALRFDKEKVEALKHLEVKYEVEKKEATIASLEERNRASRRINMLLGVASIMLIAAIALITSVARLRRRNIEQQLYEASLLAELRQEELDQTRGQIENKGNEPANSAPFAPIINKVADIIASSAIDNDIKQEYVARLQQTDAARLGSDFGGAVALMTQMDMKYVICFYIGMEARHIATMFNIEPASVYTVRYRMRKKFKDTPVARFLM